MLASTLGPTPYLVLGAMLFTVGAIGLLVRRNPLVMFMCVELMLNAVNLSFVSFSYQLRRIDGHIYSFFVMVVAAAEAAVGLARQRDDIGGQVVVFFVLGVAATEVVVGLGIIVAILRRRPDATADDISLMRG